MLINKEVVILSTDMLIDKLAEVEARLTTKQAQADHDCDLLLSQCIREELKDRRLKINSPFDKTGTADPYTIR